MVPHVAIEGELLHVPQWGFRLVLAGEVQEVPLGLSEDEGRVAARPSFELLLVALHEDCHHAAPLRRGQQFWIAADLESHLPASDGQNYLAFALVVGQFGRIAHILPICQELFNIRKAEVAGSVILRHDDDGHFLSACKHSHSQFFFIVFALFGASVEQLEEGVEALVRAPKTACFGADGSFELADEFHHLQLCLHRVSLVSLRGSLNGLKTSVWLFPDFAARGEFDFELLVDAGVSFVATDEVGLYFLPVRLDHTLHSQLGYFLHVVVQPPSGRLQIEPQCPQGVILARLLGYPCCGLREGKPPVFLEYDHAVSEFGMSVVGVGAPEEFHLVQSALVSRHHSASNILVQRQTLIKTSCLQKEMGKEGERGEGRAVGVFEYNSFMRGHQTYTLTSILNTDRIRPQLYQQILQDLKSPLEQVSIDLTHDNSLEECLPRRPDIPPPPPKSPLNQLAECNFSRTHESVSLSVGRSPQKEHFHDEVIESVLSPLDQQISFKEEPRGMAVFCGGLIDSVLGEESNFEIELPARTRLYKRRPIFGGTSASRPSKTVDQVIAILLQMGEGQMAAFFQLLRDIELELGRVGQEREGAKQYLEAILERLSGGIELVNEQQGSMATYRVLRRLRSKNTYELVSKLVREDKPERAIEANRRLESLMQSLGRLESIISRFMAREEAVDVLQAVYQSMQESFPSQPTLLGQIQRLGDSFGCAIDVSGLDFVWREGNSRRVTRQEFIQGVSMNDCVVRMPRSFEEELQSKGFQRNQ